MNSKLSPVGVLTAAWQDAGQQREDFTKAPLETAEAALMKWIDIGLDPENGIEGLEIAAALPPSTNYITNSLDPVGFHLPVYTEQDGSGSDLSDDQVRRIVDACQGKLKVFSLGAFDNHLRTDVAPQVHGHTRRCVRAARKLREAGLGTQAVATFIGFDPALSVEGNLDVLGSRMKDTWQCCKDNGIKCRLEDCPMPGWWKGNGFYKNLCCTPELIVKIFQIADALGFAEVVDLGTDMSHHILMGNRIEGVLHALKAAGYISRIGGTHGKNQHQIAALIAAFTMHGQLADFDGAAGEWARMIANHGMFGCEHYNPQALVDGTMGDFEAQQIILREAGLDLSVRPTIMEHEWLVNGNRVQDEGRIRRMLNISTNWARITDHRAALYVEAQAFCNDHADMKLPGKRYERLDPPAGIEAVVQAIMSSNSQVARIEAARKLAGPDQV